MKDDSMYRGTQPFDREQLTFICEAALAAAFDRIADSLPPTMTLEEFEEHRDGIKSWIESAQETAGMTLAIFFAQLIDDGIGIGDALHVCGMDKAVEEFVKEHADAEFSPKKSNKFHPDCRPMAEKYVKEMFGDYLGEDD